MTLATLDLRWITAISLAVMGIVICGHAIRLWWMPPMKRAALFGPYLKEPGVTLALRMIPLAFILGVFLLFTGLSKEVYYARWHGDVATEVANAIGTVEALISLWAAGSVLFATGRAWLRK